MQKYSFLSVFLRNKSKNEKMILVTGATGLVGGNLIWHLLQENDRVTAIRRSSSKMEQLHSIFSFYTSAPEDYLSRIDWKIADILHAESIKDVMIGATIVYHCAAVVSLSNYTDDTLKFNVEGTRNVVKAAIENGVEKLCFVSSIAACGRSNNNDQINENLVWLDYEDRSLYSQSKYLSEQVVWKGIEVGLNAVIVNPGVILGVSGTSSGSSQLFHQVKKGLLFYTNGGSGYVDVQDVAKLMIQLMKSDISGERFILVGENCSNKNVLNWMADGFGNRRPFIKVGNRMLGFIGVLSEIIGKIFRFSPLINRGTVRSIWKREYYSNRKIVSRIGFHFKPIEKCVHDVCQYLKNES